MPIAGMRGPLYGMTKKMTARLTHAKTPGKRGVNGAVAAEVREGGWAGAIYECRLLSVELQRVTGDLIEILFRETFSKLIWWPDRKNSAKKSARKSLGNGSSPWLFLLRSI